MSINKTPIITILTGSSGGSISYFGAGETLSTYIRTLTYDNVDVDIAMTNIAAYNSTNFPKTRMKYSCSRYLGNLESVTKPISSILSSDDGRNQLDVTKKYNNAIQNAGTIFSTPLMFYQYLIPALVNGSSYLPANTTCYRLTDMTLISSYFCNPNNPNNNYTKLTTSIEYFENPKETTDTTALPNNSGFYYNGNAVSTCSNTYATAGYISILNDIGQNNIFTNVVSFTENTSNRAQIIFKGYTLYVREAHWQTISGTVSQDVTQLICELVQQALKNVGSPSNATNVITAWNISDEPIATPSQAVPNGDIILNVDTSNYFGILTDIAVGQVKTLSISLDLYPTGVTPLNLGLTHLYPYYTF